MTKDCEYCPSPAAHHVLVWTGKASGRAAMTTACAECAATLRERLPVSIRCDFLDDDEAVVARVMVEPEEGAGGLKKIMQNAMRLDRLVSALSK